MNFSSILKCFLVVAACMALRSNPLVAQSMRLVEVAHNFADCDGLAWASFYPDGNSVVFAGCFNWLKLLVMRWNIGEDTIATSIADSTEFSSIGMAPIAGVSWNRDSSVLLTGGVRAALWNSKSWESPQYLPRKDLPVMCVDFAPNNKDILMLTWYGVEVVDVETGEVLRMIGNEGTYAKRWLDISSDGSRLVVVTDSGDIRMYDYESGEKLWSVKQGPFISNVQFHPNDSRLLILGIKQDGTSSFMEAAEYDAVNGKKLMSYVLYKGSISSARYNHDGTRMVTTNTFDSLVHVWNTETGDLLAVAKFGDIVWWAEFSKEGRIVVAGGRRVGVLELQPPLSVSEPVAGESVDGRLNVQPNPVRGMLSVPFTLPVASDVRLVLYDMTGKEVQVFASGEYDAGEHRIVGDLSNIPSGPYLILLRSEEDVLYRQIQVIR